MSMFALYWVTGCRAILGSFDECARQSDCDKVSSGLVCVDHLCVKDESDAGARDDGGPLSDADAAVAIDAGGAPLLNPDFETPGPECGPGWSATNATLERSSEANSGKSACLVCRVSTPGQIRSLAGGASIVSPGTYRLSGALKNATGKPSTNAVTVAFLAVKATAIQETTTKVVGPLVDYNRFTVNVDAPAGSDALGVMLSNFGGADGSCFLVDDLTIERLK